MADDLDAALTWADMTMNARLRDARRTGTDGDYEDKVEWCIDTLAAAVRQLRKELETVTRVNMDHALSLDVLASGAINVERIVALEADLAAARDELAVATSLYHTAKEQLARVSAR